MKYEPDFAALVNRASERKHRSAEKWKNDIYNLYGATIDPITLTYRRLTGKIHPHDLHKIRPTPPAGPTPVPVSPHVPAATSASPAITTVTTTAANVMKSLSSLCASDSKFQTPQRLLKNSSLAYMLVMGPLMYPRMLVILCAIVTLLFRLSEHRLREQTAFLSDTLDLVINVYFIFEGVLRLFTIPAVFEIRRRHEEEEIPLINSFTYEILRCGWLEIIISLLSIAISSQYDSTNAICWFNLFRLSFIANFFILELPQFEILLVSPAPPLLVSPFPL